MNIWDFSNKLARRLLVWSALSVIVSTLTYFSAVPFLRGLGIQFFAWGVIDGAIAVFGARASAKKKRNVQETERAESEANDARWLSRILWINTGLDVLYILGGLWLMQTWGANNPIWQGHGVGIIVQGGFLFLFDFYHAGMLRKALL
ncbi:MAG TPA: hypothetical protein VJ972_06010 [Anaerolineales bacterium]|nr:hypothetical protein [Anaerolineales bacterium]